MRYEVNIGVRVYERLDSSLDYIAVTLGEPQAATSLLGAFEGAIEQLELFPDNHPVQPQITSMLGVLVRRAPVQNFGLFYYVDKPSRLVQAFSFLHSRQDVPAHISSDFAKLF